MNFNNFLDWFSVISFVANLILVFITVWQVVKAQYEARRAKELAEQLEKRKQDQVKIWMQDAFGLVQGLTRIVKDNLDNRYSSTNDIANAVWTIQATADALRQSLYEERCITEPEYKQQQKELMEELKKNMAATSQNIVKNEVKKVPTANQS